MVIDDPIPAGTTPTESEPDCVLGASFTCTTSAALAPGASISYGLTLALPSNSALVTLANTASITSSPIADPNGANDSATDTDTVTTSADLSIVKTDSADPISPGNTVDYTITVTNTGPSDAANLQVRDAVPAPALFSITGSWRARVRAGTSATTSRARSAPCRPPVPGYHHLGHPGSAHAWWDVYRHRPGDVSDHGSVPGNDTDSESTIVLPAVDMVVTKTDGVASVTAGTSTTYTIT